MDHFFSRSNDYFRENIIYYYINNLYNYKERNIMKNILAILFGILLFANINAQESASSPTMWIGGVVAYTDENSAYTIGPTFGTMLNQNMAVGGTLTLMGSDDGSGWNIEPYFRNYWPI